MHFLKIRSIPCLLILIVSIFIPFSGCQREKLYGYKPPNYFKVTRDDLHSVMAIDSEKIWVVGTFGEIYQTYNEGITWKFQNSGVDGLAQLCKVDFVDDQYGWIVGSYGIILHTKDGGKTWTAQDSKTSHLLLNFDFVDTQHGWIVGEKSTLLRTKDGGVNWELQFDEMGPVYNGVYFLDRQTGWIVGDYGTIIHTTDGGKSWKKQECKDIIPVIDEAEWWKPIPALFDIHFVDAKKGLICGIDGIILVTEDGGLNWRKVPTHTKLAIYAVAAKGKKAWAIGEKGNYLISNDGGSHWNVVTDAIKTRQWLRGISFSSSNHGWIVGGKGTVLKTIDGGNHWEMISGQSYETR